MTKFLRKSLFFLLLITTIIFFSIISYWGWLINNNAKMLEDIFAYFGNNYAVFYVNTAVFLLENYWVSLLMLFGICILKKYFVPFLLSNKVSFARSIILETYAFLLIIIFEFVILSFGLFSVILMWIPIYTANAK